MVSLIPIIIGGIWLYKREVSLRKANKEVRITFLAFLIKKWWTWVIIMVLSLRPPTIINFLVGLVLSGLFIWIWWLIVRRIFDDKNYRKIKNERTKEEA